MFLFFVVGCRDNRLVSIRSVIFNFDCYWCREVYFIVLIFEILYICYNKEDVCYSFLFLDIFYFEISCVFLVF